MRKRKNRLESARIIFSRRKTEKTANCWRRQKVSSEYATTRKLRRKYKGFLFFADNGGQEKIADWFAKRRFRTNEPFRKDCIFSEEKMNGKGGGERNGYGNFQVCRMFCEAAVKLSRFAAVSKIFSFFLWSGGFQAVFLFGEERFGRRYGGHKRWSDNNCVRYRAERMGGGLGILLHQSSKNRIGFYIALGRRFPSERRKMQTLSAYENKVFAAAIWNKDKLYAKS